MEGARFPPRNLQPIAKTARGGRRVCVCVAKRSRYKSARWGIPSLCSLHLLTINNKPSERVWRQAVGTKVFPGSWVGPVRKE